jgi:hypothetical protein
MKKRKKPLKGEMLKLSKSRILIKDKKNDCYYILAKDSEKYEKVVEEISKKLKAGEKVGE